MDTTSANLFELIDDNSSDDLNDGKDSEKLCKYPLNVKDAVTVYKKDFDSLDQEHWLNDRIIDFYLKIIFYKLTDTERNTVHVFPTTFYKRLTTKHARDGSEKNLSKAEKQHKRVK